MNKDEGSRTGAESIPGGSSVDARVELRHLRYFRAVAEELSFTRAAERLHIAQPPLSQQIKQLEDDLGVLLVDRTERPLRLTKAGRHLHKRASEILADVQTTITEVKRIGRGLQGQLTIGFAGSAMYSLLPRVINAYRARYPGVELVFTELLAAEIGAALDARRIDVGISRPGLDSATRFEQELLANEPLIIAAPEQHPLSRELELSLNQLQGEDVILYPRYPLPSLTDLILRTLETRAVRVQIVQEAGNLQTALGLVSAGVGITFVPASVGAYRRDGIRFMPLKSPILFSPISLVWRQETRSPTLQHFLDVIEEYRPSPIEEADASPRDRPAGDQ